MRVIHTSDWHLGQELHGFDRGVEQDTFLDWLAGQLITLDADALIVTGDVYDTVNSAVQAQQRLYQFLRRALADTPSLQIVLIGGNHDSAARLELPKHLLDANRIHLIGAMPRHDGRTMLARTLIELRDKTGTPCAVCAAVPYLRPGDLPAVGAAEERAELATRELSRIETEKATLTSAKDWYDTKARLDARVAGGEKALATALKADGISEHDHAALALAKKALALRAELEAAAATNDRLAKAESALSDAVTADQKAADRRDKAVLASTVSKVDRDEMRAAYDALGPQLDKAQRLDAVIEATKTELARRAEVLDQCIREKHAARKAVTAVEEALRTAHDQREADSRWLGEHTCVEVLSARIEEAAKDLSERVDLENQIASAARHIEFIDGEVRAQVTAREAKEREVVALQARERELSKTIEPLRKIAEGIDRAAAETTRERIIRVQTALDDARDAANSAAKAQRGIASADAEKARQDAVIGEAKGSISQIDVNVPVEAARLDEARRSLDLSEAASSEAAEHLRLTLKAGHPCPVCGAIEHPVTEVDRRLKARVDTDRGHVTELGTRIATLRTDRAHAEARIAAAEEWLPTIARRRSDSEADVEAARTQWGASIAVVRSGCDEIGVALPLFAEAAAEPGATEPLTPAFPDWKAHVVAVGTGFATVCHDLVDNWRTCGKRVEASNTAISRLAADLEGSRATCAAKEAAVGEAEKQHLEKRDDFNTLIGERGEVIGGRPIAEVRTEYRLRWEVADKVWNEADTARSDADKAAAAAASNVISARNTVNSTLAARDSADRVLVERLQVCEISKESMRINAEFAAVERDPDA